MFCPLVCLVERAVKCGRAGTLISRPSSGEAGDGSASPRTHWRWLAFATLTGLPLRWPSAFLDTWGTLLNASGAPEAGGLAPPSPFQLRPKELPCWRFLESPAPRRPFIPLRTSVPANREPEGTKAGILYDMKLICVPSLHDCLGRVGLALR